ncbi:MAG TPA: Hsp20/alpha crystallin family protein [Caldimonas sp.]|nr:Hsp20/alpha crystallin family protein [Caldimonas sp.]
MQPQSNSTAMQTQQPQQVQSSGNTRTAPALLPPVDIFEDAGGITLCADLPGVGREDLAIGVDGRNLTIEAPLKLGEANSLTPVYAEVRANHFRRSFELSGDLDTAKIDAGLRDGVLTLRIPKLEQAKPRRIDVRVE